MKEAILNHPIALVGFGTIQQQLMAVLLLLRLLERSIHAYYSRRNAFKAASACYAHASNCCCFCSRNSRVCKSRRMPLFA